MERYSIAFIAFLMFCAAHVHAQFMPGNVVVHSDPRLAVLLKKNPTAAPPATPVYYGDEPVKRSRPIHPAPELPKSQLPGAPTHQVPLVNAAPTAPVHRFVEPAIHKDSRVIYEGRGFRVQIYNGYDREKAIKVRTEFMRLYPGMRTYLTYLSPCFRVKVGDYRNRSDAVGMLREANSMYKTPCMIVPDMVTVHAY